MVVVLAFFNQEKAQLPAIRITFLDCQLTSSFTRQVMGWFNATNNTSFNPEPKEIVFGLFKQCLDGHRAVRKFNYTFLYMMYYIYSNKLKESSIINFI